MGVVTAREAAPAEVPGLDAPCVDECEAIWDGGEFIGWACLSTGVMTNCRATTTTCYVDICFASPDELLDPEGEVIALVSACSPGTVLADAWRGISEAGRARADVLDLIPGEWMSQQPVPE
jgi:hypothetical protein